MSDTQRTDTQEHVIRSLDVNNAEMFYEAVGFARKLERELHDATNLVEQLTKYVEHMEPFMEDEHCTLCDQLRAAVAAAREPK